MGGSEACCCCGWWRQEDASSASRAGLSQSPQLLAEKPKINMFEGSESNFSPSQDYLQSPLHVLGQGGRFSLPRGRQQSPGWEGLSLSLLSFCLQTSAATATHLVPNTAALFLWCPALRGHHPGHQHSQPLS